MNSALGCITPARFAVPSVVRSMDLNDEHGLIVGKGQPVPIKGTARMLFYAGQSFRVVSTERDDPRGPFKVVTIQYSYQYLGRDEKEIVSFHWTPEETREGMKTYPHLHIGSSLLSTEGPILAGRFHKVHIPTDRVSLERVVRFGIEELGVEPLVTDWNERLTRTEALFRYWKTR